MVAGAGWQVPRWRAEIWCNSFVHLSTYQLVEGVTKERTQERQPDAVLREQVNITASSRYVVVNYL